MKCEECGKEVYVIYITREYKRICDLCHDEKKKEKEK